MAARAGAPVTPRKPGIRGYSAGAEVDGVLPSDLYSSPNSRKTRTGCCCFEILNLCFVRSTLVLDLDCFCILLLLIYTGLSPLFWYQDVLRELDSSHPALIITGHPMCFPPPPLFPPVLLPGIQLYHDGMCDRGRAWARSGPVGADESQQRRRERWAGHNYLHHCDYGLQLEG